MTKKGEVREIFMTVLKQVFDRFASTHDGLMTHDDFKAFLAETRQSMEDEEIQDLFYTFHHAFDDR